ncbi:MAG: glycosyltransferase [Campylobacterales bacterium]|nr:glycosyltransferase [Campylobacterales bacterium]
MQDLSIQDKIKIVLVTDTLFDTNGVSRFIHDMVHHASKYNATLYAIAVASDNTPLTSPFIIRLKPFLAMRMPFYKEQSLQVIPPLLSLWKKIRALKPDIIHISTPGPLGWSALFMAKILKIPTAGTYHTDFPAFLEENTGSKIVGKITTWFMHRFYKRMCFTFSRSKSYIKIIEEEIGIDQKKIVFLSSGTDTQKFHPSFKEKGFWTRYGITKDALILLYVGRLNVEKNLLFLIDRFREFKEETKQKVVLVLVGEGEYVRYTDEWKQEGIFYLGVKRGEELSSIYANSDIFISASTTETLGQTVMEAQASGVCAIVTNQGGVVESVQDGISGYTLSIDAPETWVETLKELTINQQKKAQMGQAGFHQMQERSIEASCQAFIEEHKRALI